MQTTTITFTELHLMEPIHRVLIEAGFKTPTPIQTQAIPHLLTGVDLIGCAETGTGKTAAFALPILQRLAMTQKRASRKCMRVLVLTPTRELSAQVQASFQTFSRYLRLSTTLVVGGVHQRPQVHAMANGVDVLVATPGRLLDLIEQGYIRLSEVECLVLDEADRMLDMGFLPAIKTIISLLPSNRQTLLFSATMEPSIVQLAKTVLRNPVHVTVQQPIPMIERLDERVMFVEDGNKRDLLSSLLKEKGRKRILVFTRTKRRADSLAKHLEKTAVKAKAIHGDKSQQHRNATLAAFRTGRCDVLVATDVVARGIDVDNVTHVINFDLPNDPSNYIHRIGRTARAGAHGIAHSFCGNEEQLLLRDIERLLKRSMTIHKEHPYHSDALENAHVRSLQRTSQHHRPKRSVHRQARPFRSKRRSNYAT